MDFIIRNLANDLDHTSRAYDFFLRVFTARFLYIDENLTEWQSIKKYMLSLSVISAVIYGKRQQLISSVFIILVLMLGSSLCMYSLEHEAQPEVFTNAFSGIWWAASTLLTVGYGDIYPITTLGKIFGIFITFLGVGMVAIPTGIISAGFVDQYTTLKIRNEYGYESDMHFIKIHISVGDCACKAQE